VTAETERVPSTELGELETGILEFERAWGSRIGGRESAIRDRFGFSAARYHQLLSALLDSPIALRHDPQLVRRLQRLRDSRRRARARTFRIDSQDLTD
jgi:hypothetical protein